MSTPPTNEPIDQDVRDAATGTLDRSFALSAGAGSGKTAVLTERLVALLAAGAPPGAIAAITFTEKAAGELQRRVRDALEVRFAEAPTDALREALDGFHELTLSTIHAFCRELLAAEPLASRWAPGTEIQHADRAGLRPALTTWRAGLRERDGRLALLLDQLLDDWQAEQAAAQLLGRRDLTPAAANAPLDWEAATRSLTAYRDRLAELSAEKPEGTLTRKNATFLDRLSAWVEAGADGVLVALAHDRKKAGASKQGERKGEWAEAFKAHVDAYDEWRAGVLAGAHRTLVRSLHEEVLPELLAHRRQLARADFDDLLFRAAALLREPTVRARLARRYRALLVDEVQDTDPIQAEIATLLARDPAATGPWTDSAPRPGHLFAVGDPKQSIYRFRRADVTVWRDLQRVVGAADPAGVTTLRQNFRSVPGLVAWANHTFADLPGYVAQAPWRAPAELDPVVLVEAPEAESGGEEADAALRHLLALGEASARVVDRDSGELRPLRWGDVMVLVPRWSNAQAIAERFLQAGVEAVVEGGGAFFGCDEVKLAVSALRALDEPGDAEAVVHVLRGLFGLTPAELAAHRHAAGGWRYTVPEQPEGPIAGALAVLRELRRQPHETGSWIPRLDALLARTRATATWSLLVDGPARLANLDKLRAILRELEGETRSPTQVVTRLVELQKKNEEDELPIIDAESDAVRVTTVFKAKGLEAPVVVLLDLDRGVRTPSVVPDRRAGEVHLKVGSLAPPGWSETAEAEKEALEREQRRWMYVAGTRARDQLVVVRSAKASLLAHLAVGLPEPGAAEHEDVAELSAEVRVRVRHAAALEPVPYQQETFPGRDGRVDALLEAPEGKGDPAGEARAREMKRAVKAAQRRCARWRSVGEVAARQRGFEPGDDGEGGTGVGRAGGVVVHRAMEQLDLRRPPEALREEGVALARALAEEAGLSEVLRDACAEVVQKLLAHPVLERARRAPERWQETPFAIEERGRVVAGVIDLCFPVDEARRRWVVVDWKSDAPPEGSALRQRYEAQLALYARALIRTVAPCEEVETVLVGPHAELPSEPAEDALELVEPGFRASLARLLEAGAPVPRVGAEVGEPIVAELELAWERARVGLALERTPEEREALEALGWTLVVAERGDPSWPHSAESALRAALGLTSEDDDAEAADVTGENDPSAAE